MPTASGTSPRAFTAIYSSAWVSSSARRCRFLLSWGRRSKRAALPTPPAGTGASTGAREHPTADTGGRTNGSRLTRPLPELDGRSLSWMESRGRAEQIRQRSSPRVATDLGQKTTLCDAPCSNALPAGNLPGRPPVGLNLLRRPRGASGLLPRGVRATARLALGSSLRRLGGAVPVLAGAPVLCLPLPLTSAQC